MKAQSPSELLASLQETVKRLESEETRKGSKSSHAELKRLLQKRIADLEAATKPPHSQPSASDTETDADMPSSVS